MTAPAVTWGEALGVRIRQAGGMPGIADRLRDGVWGSAAESRSTLDKLRGFSSPEDMDGEERWRAYQVLVTIGEDPIAWGIQPEALDVPPSLVAYFNSAISGTPTDPAATDIAPKQAKRRKNPRHAGSNVSDTPSYRAPYVTMGKCASTSDTTADALATSTAA